MKWMIYGANGYTGEIIARKAKELGMAPTLAGRNKEAITKLAQQLNLPFRVFACENAQEIHKHLIDMHTVLHCAGPFRFTFKPMFEACLLSKTNYLDIAGEIKVFEKIIASKEQLQQANISAIGGVGFDVVPTDCLAKILKEKMPDAEELKLAIKLESGVSPGSAKTLIEAFYAGGLIRKNGKFKLVPPIYLKEDIVFEKNPETTISLPWGDVSTAFHSTNIPNIVVLFCFPPKVIQMIALTRYVRFILGSKWLQKTLRAYLGKKIQGPTAEQRASCRSFVWGEVKNKEGKAISYRLITQEGYDFTAISAVTIVQKVLNEEVKPGGWTPSQAFGGDFVLTLPNVQLFPSK